MRAEELRIGNWVYMGSDYGDEQVTAYQIYNFNMTRNQTADYYREWQPIPLTEEWLERFGLKREMVWVWSTHIRHDTIMLFDVGTKSVEFARNRSRSAIIIPNIHYVHQLQNLYFALTGEEL